MAKWKCFNWTEDTDIEHDDQCDCFGGCGGILCLTCCEEDMFGTEED